jgi:hypothetical protein
VHQQRNPNNVLDFFKANVQGAWEIIPQAVWLDTRKNDDQRQVFNSLVALLL